MQLCTELNQMRTQVGILGGGGGQHTVKHVLPYVNQAVFFTSAFKGAPDGDSKMGLLKKLACNCLPIPVKVITHYTDFATTTVKLLNTQPHILQVKYNMQLKM